MDQQEFRNITKNFNLVPFKQWGPIENIDIPTKLKQMEEHYMDRLGVEEGANDDDPGKECEKSLLEMVEQWRACDALDNNN
jgi:hypothetical protein